MTDSPPDLRLLYNDEAARYEVWVGDTLAGFITTRKSHRGIAMNHAEIAHAFEGHGVGSALAKFALDDARSQGKLVVPQCPFVAQYIEHHPAYADLVAP